MRKHSKLGRTLTAAEREGRCAWTRDRSLRQSLRARVTTGEVLAVKPDLYVRPAYWQSLGYWERIMHVLRAVASMHPPWVFWGISAAPVWLLNETYAMHDVVHLAVTHSTSSRDRGYFSFHYVGLLEPVRCNGLLVTDLLQTVFDCARSLPFPQALAICDAALRIHHVDKERLAAFCAEHRGHTGVQRAVFVATYADARSENGGESIIRAWLIVWGYAPPELQQWFRSPIDGRSYRVDFLWRLPDGRIIILELDGREKYVNPTMLNGGDVTDAVLAEKRRENDLMLIGGISIVRTTYDEATREPWALQRRLDLAGVPKATPPVIPPSPMAP